MSSQDSHRLARVFPRLMSALGGIGCGARETPQYFKPADLLAHMDRLGVTHSLVYHAAARDHDTTRGNQRLLRELAECPEAHGRLFPALAVSPTQYWERGGIEALQAAMKTSATRALWAFPAALRYRIHQLEPVLEAVASLEPFVMVDIREVGDVEDIVRLAEAFPRMPIVCTQGMWGHLIPLMDLARRKPNIFIETSWLHVWGTIRDLTRHFGVERVVFGLGPKAHQGAAIAGLAHAQISEPERQAIAYDNLARLMGLPPSPPLAQPAPAREVSPPRGGYWADFLRGAPVSDGIIDAHGHLGAVHTWALAEHDIDEQIRQILPRMDRLGIATMVISGLDALFSDPVEGNRLLADHLRPHGERFKAYCTFNPIYADRLVPQMERFLADPVFVGFKLLCDYWAVPVTDARLTPMWEYAHAHRLPILLHTWEGPYNSPRLLTDIVARYSEAIFLLGHSGGGNAGRAEAEQLANANPNVYLEWCGSFCCSTPWEETLARVHSRQVVFGTDGVCHDLSWELGRLLSLNVPDATIKPILSDNMRRVLALRR